jgi:HAD superfamily hydrolase (TIGR01509 family)
VAARYRAAIFDFDGTLVDTMPLHFEAYRRVFAEMGLDLAPAQFYRHVGGNARETIPRFLGGRPAPLSLEEIHARKKATLAEMLAAQVPLPVLETAKLLPLLRPFMKIALCSSGSRPGIDRMLERLGWKAHFDVVVTGEEVPAGKPAPDLFLAAAARLEVQPADCFVFEDTDDGVAAGRAAGMEVFDVRSAPAARLRGAGP